MQGEVTLDVTLTTGGLGHGEGVFSHVLQGDQ